MAKYDWDNDDLEEEGLVEKDTTYPDITAKMPGINLESEQTGSMAMVEEEEISDLEVAIAAAVNEDIEPSKEAQNLIEEMENPTNEEAQSI